MLTRRSAATLLAGVAVAPATAWADDPNPHAIFCNAVGPDLTWWEVDVGNAALKRQGHVTVPAKIQYVWRHTMAHTLYVASSNFVPVGEPDGKHHISAFRINSITGALTEFAQPVALRARPIHITVDHHADYLLTAYNSPSMMTVHHIQQSSSIGEEVKQAAPIDCGVFAHQIRMLPSYHELVLVTRGNNKTDTKPEDPGALKIKAFHDGQVMDIASVAPGGGYGFGPRHVDFHPGNQWMYVSVERQNQLHMYRLRGDNPEPKPAYVATTLQEPGNLRPEQMVGPIHVHPNGKSVYLGNRASGLVEIQGKKVAAGGENSIAVFTINPKTGEPKLVQNIDTHGYHPRTFSIDPSGRMLVVANVQEQPVRDGDGVRTQPATLSTYRIGNDGRLTLVKVYDIETNAMTQFWSGFVTL